MDKEKQVTEMASDINDCITEFVTGTGDVYIDDEATAQKMFDKGYRKIRTTDWLTRGISKEQLEKEKDESLKEFFERNCKKYDYRKQSDVAREIFGEIEDRMSCFEDDDDGYLLKKCEFEFFMRELKKKYTEEPVND